MKCLRLLVFGGTALMSNIRDPQPGSTSANDATPAASYAWRAGWQGRGWKGNYFGFHCHSTLEIVHHAGGSGTTRMRNGRSIDFREGMVVVYPPRMIHDHAVAESGVIACIHVDVAGPLPRELKRGLAVQAVTDEYTARELAYLSGPVLAATDRDQEILNHRITALLLSLVREGASSWQQKPVPAAVIYAEKARSYLQQNLGSLRRLTEVSTQLGISYDYLRHVFRQRFGVNPSEWLRDLRLAQARQLLARSNMPQKSIAGFCGYSTERYFSATFHRHAGLTPGAYRLRAQEEHRR